MERAEYVPELNDKQMFDPDQNFEKQEKEKREEDFHQAMLDIMRKDLHPAEAGSRAGRAFVRLLEVSILDDDKIAHDITEAEKYVWSSGVNPRDCRMFLAGWTTELAVAHFFYESAGHTVYLSTTEQDSKKIDFITTGPDDHKYLIQAKTLFLKDNGSDQPRPDIPIINPLGSIEDLNKFFSNISKVLIDNEVRFSIVTQEGHKEFSPPLSNEQVLLLSANWKTLTVRAYPDPEFIETHDTADSRLEDLLKDAITMYKKLRDADQTPVIMIMGSPESELSDVNTKQGRLSKTAAARATRDMATLEDRT